MTERTFSARLGCRYLLHLPEKVDAQTVLVAALHGFSGNAEDMLAHPPNGRPAPRDRRHRGHTVSLSAGGQPCRYGWITNRRAAESIRLHHEMVLHVLEEAGCECNIPAERRVLLGFSQPVSINYRFAEAYPDSVRGVVGICGGLPGDWDDQHPGRIGAAVLHIARREDEFYPAERTEQYAPRLRLRCDDVEFHLLDGTHRFPSRSGPVWDKWLNRILG
jgi:predicted esterase